MSKSEYKLLIIFIILALISVYKIVTTDPITVSHKSNFKTEMLFDGGHFEE